MCAGRTVAVKQLSVSSLAGVGDREFLLEVALLSRLHHCHLVQLVGYCGDAHERLLVYEYMPAGTLREHLNGQRRAESACTASQSSHQRPIICPLKPHCLEKDNGLLTSFERSEYDLPF